jgi:glycosyltransferase 2 family protein
MVDPSSNLVRPSPRPWRLGLSWLFGLLILAAVVVAASHFTEIERFGEIARTAQPAWLLGAFGLQAMTYICAAGVWYAALRRAGVRQSFWAIVPLGLAKLFTDQALPTGGIGGTFLVVNGLARRGVPKGIAMAALIIGMISFYAAYLTAAAVALGILYYSGALDPLMVLAAAIFVLVAVGIPVSVLALRQWSSVGSGRSVSWVGKWLRRIPGAAMLLSTIASAPGGLLKEPTPFLWATALQLLVFALDSATLWIMLQAVGAEATAPSAFAAFMMASIAATVGPMPLGLGTFEGVCITVLHIQGLSVEIALTATLLLRGFTFWLPMIPGLLLARRELHPSAERGHASCEP